MELATYLATNPEGFTLNERGNIRQCGKFEGEPLWAPYFYSVGLDGFADETFSAQDGGGTETDVFFLHSTESEALADFDARTTGSVRLGADQYAVVLLHYSEDGFVQCETVTRAGYDEREARTCAVEGEFYEPQ